MLKDEGAEMVFSDNFGWERRGVLVQRVGALHGGLAQRDYVIEVAAGLSIPGTEGSGSVF